MLGASVKDSFFFWYIGAPQTHPNNTGGSTGVTRMSGMEKPMDRTYIPVRDKLERGTSPSGPVVKNPPSSAEDAGGETKIPLTQGS